MSLEWPEQRLRLQPLLCHKKLINTQQILQAKNKRLTKFDHPNRTPKKDKTTVVPITMNWLAKFCHSCNRWLTLRDGAVEVGPTYGVNKLLVTKHIHETPLVDNLPTRRISPWHAFCQDGFLTVQIPPATNCSRPTPGISFKPKTSTADGSSWKPRQICQPWLATCKNQ